MTDLKSRGGDEMPNIKVVIYGLGPIGAKMVQFLLSRRSFDIVGAVDIASDKIGKDIGEIAGMEKPYGVLIEANGAKVLEKAKPHVVVLTTTSILEKIKPQIMEIIEHGVNVVSTCEELTFPWVTNPVIAKEIDNQAQQKGVSVLATGVNPGFLMDFLPLAVTAVCRQVDNITVYRVQDATNRRLSFQQKVGVGITINEFHERVKKGALRHVGLTESMHMIASKIGWHLGKTEDIIEPVVAEKRTFLKDKTIEKGDVLGVKQTGLGYVGQEVVITLNFIAAAGIDQSYDRIVVNGIPVVDMSIKNGINGDIATCAMVMNAIPVVLQARPGLRTMADIEPVSCFL